MTVDFSSAATISIDCNLHIKPGQNHPNLRYPDKRTTTNSSKTKFLLHCEKKIACGIREKRISCYTNSPWSTTKWPVQRLINHYEKNTLGSKTQKLSLKNQRRQQWIRNDNAKEGMAPKDLGQFALPFTLWTAPWIKGATSIKTRHDLLICMGSQGLPSRR